VSGERGKVMANRKGDCVGSGSAVKSVGKVGKVKVDSRQSRIAMEEREGGKRVTFKLEERKEEIEKQEVGVEGATDMKVMIRQMVRKEIEENLREQEDKLKKKIEELKGRVKSGEERLEVK